MNQTMDAATLEQTIHHHDADGTDVFGFWLYILTDLILFASLFATYLVLHSPNAFGPSLKEHLNLNYILVETFLLLASNFTFGMAVLAYKDKHLAKTQRWLTATFLLGAAFVAMELYEFKHLIHLGYHWVDSGAASSFFVLVATHGLHVTVGLLWIIITIVQLAKFKITNLMEKRLVLLGLFWNFLDIVWIFVFSIVYLMGAI